MWILTLRQVMGGVRPHTALGLGRGGGLNRHLTTPTPRCTYSTLLCTIRVVSTMHSPFTHFTRCTCHLLSPHRSHCAPAIHPLCAYDAPTMYAAGQRHDHTVARRRGAGAAGGRVCHQRRQQRRGAGGGIGAAASRLGARQRHGKRIVVGSE